MQLGIPKRMHARLREYDGYHTVPGNEACHFVGIPLIILGTAGLLVHLPITRVGPVLVTFTELVGAAVVGFYLVAAGWLGVITAAILTLLLVLGRELPLWLSIVAFAGGWAAQFIGHSAFEKSSPAFLRNLVHLLVGPAWLVERLLARFGTRTMTN